MSPSLLRRKLTFKIHYVTHCLTAYLYPGIIGGNVDLPPSHPGGDVVALPCSYSDYTDSQSLGTFWYVYFYKTYLLPKNLQSYVTLLPFLNISAKNIIFKKFDQKTCY